MSILLCEVGNEKNQNFHFRPLQRKIRGCFDWMRCPSAEAKVKGATEPNPIPGQRLEFDFERGVGAIVEPLHAPEHRVIRERIEAKGQRLPDAREEFALDSATAWFWLRSAIGAGIVKIVSGKLPETQPAGTVRRNFITAEKEPATDRLAVAIERQNELFAALLGELRSKKG